MARALADRFFGPRGDPEALGALTPAADWRLLEGPALTGVLRMSEDREVADGRYGFFAFRIDQRGVFEGIYNVKPGGESLVGVFWPDGKLNDGPASGFLDLKAAETGGAEGGLTFVKGASVDDVSAR